MDNQEKTTRTDEVLSSLGDSAKMAEEERRAEVERYYAQVNDMILQLKDAVSDIGDLYFKGNKAAGVRARNRLFQVKKTCENIRTEIKPSKLPIERLREKYKNYGFKNGR